MGREIGEDLCDQPEIGVERRGRLQQEPYTEVRVRGGFGGEEGGVKICS